MHLLFTFVLPLSQVSEAFFGPIFSDLFLFVFQLVTPANLASSVQRTVVAQMMAIALIARDLVNVELHL